MFSVKLASRWRKEKIAIDKFWLKFKKIIQITGFLLCQTCDCVTASCFNIVGCWAPTCVLQGRFWSRSSSCWCFVGCHWHTWRWPLVSTLAGDQSEQLENYAHFSKVWDLFCDVLKCFAVDTFCSYIYIYTLINNLHLFSQSQSHCCSNDSDCNIHGDVYCKWFFNFYTNYKSASLSVSEMAGYSQATAV